VFVREKWRSLHVDGWVRFVFMDKFRFIKGDLKECHVSHSSKVAGNIQEAKEFTSLQNDERSSNPKALLFMTCV